MESEEGGMQGYRGINVVGKKKVGWKKRGGERERNVEGRHGQAGVGGQGEFFSLRQIFAKVRKIGNLAVGGNES